MTGRQEIEPIITAPGISSITVRRVTSSPDSRFLHHRPAERVKKGRKSQIPNSKSQTNSKFQCSKFKTYACREAKGTVFFIPSSLFLIRKRCRFFHHRASSSPITAQGISSITVRQVSSSPDFKFSHHRAVYFSTFYLLRSTGGFTHRPQCLRILIIAPYSFFFIPYSESVPVFSSPSCFFFYFLPSTGCFTHLYSLNYTDWAFPYPRGPWYKKGSAPVCASRKFTCGRIP